MKSYLKKHVVLKKYFFITAKIFILFLILTSANNTSLFADQNLTLKSASEYDYPPFCTVTPDGQADGFSIDLLKETVKNMDININFTVGEWAVIKNDLAEGKIDVLPLVGRTPQRDAIYDFTFPYLTLHGAVFVRKGETTIKSIEDLKDMEIIVMAGDNAEEYVVREKISAKIIAVKSYKDAMNLLISGKHDAVIAQRLMGITLLKEMNITGIVPLDYILTDFKQTFSFAVKKGDDKLLAMLNEGLAIAMSDGTYTRLYNKWFTPILGEKIPFKQAIDYILPILIPGIILIAIVFIVFLRREVKRKTKILSEEISEHKKLEQALQKKEEEYRSTLDILLIGVVVHDANTNILLSNPEASNILGLSKEQLLGKESIDPVWKFVKEDMSEMTIEDYPISRAIATKKTFKDYILGVIRPDRKDVIWVNVSAIPLFTTNGELEKVVINFIDISATKKAENGLLLAKEKAEENEKYIKMLFESSPMGLLLNELTGEFVDVNTASAQIIGYTPQEVLKLTYWDVTPKCYEKQEHEVLKSLKEKGSYGPYEKEYIHKSGRLIPVRLNGRIIEKDGRKLIWSSIEDITDIKKLEHDLILAKEKAEENDRLKSSFLGNMSHEIRTPMNGILGFADILKESNVTRTEQLEFIDIIEKSGQRMLTLINDLINISKIESGLMELFYEETNINDQLNNLFNFFKLEAKKKGLKLLVTIPLKDSQAIINTDKEKLDAILINLIKNAIKFTPKGSVEFGYKVESDCLRFYTKDTGIGISPDKHKAVFERFIQADLTTSRGYDGSGLGLSISKAYVELLGGQIFVESDLGKGTEFSFTIPLVKKTSPKHPLEKNEIEVEYNQSAKTILIAEDDEISLQYLTHILKEHKLLTAKTGQEAIDLCNKEKNIDIALMDIQMPVMDGMTATKQIKKIRPDLPIIAQTAFALNKEIQTYSALFDGYITKPIDPAELKKILNQFLNKN